MLWFVEHVGFSMHDCAGAGMNGMGCRHCHKSVVLLPGLKWQTSASTVAAGYSTRLRGAECVLCKWRAERVMYVVCTWAYCLAVFTSLYITAASFDMDVLHWAVASATHKTKAL